MKLRLDEYYYIVGWEWDGIENYMPKDMAKELEFEAARPLPNCGGNNCG